MTSEIAAKIDKFFSSYRLRKYPKGQILLLDGDAANYVYYIIEGTVKQYDVSYRGDEIILNVFKHPAFLPMSLAINKGPNPCIYEADSDLMIRQAPAADVVKFLQTNPDVMFDLLSRLYRGVDGLLGRMSYLMHGTATSRLLYELIIECRRFGKQQTNGAYLLKMNETDLGARAGLARETVNRELHKLKRDKLFEVRPTGILVHDLTKLEAKLGRDI